ncbi:MAG: cysteine--tRNA ligase, partial [Gammaproteobacteria bacterium]|nr:cysteine--tRNA ligase [Gammaproteobacteria bacterium]
KAALTRLYTALRGLSVVAPDPNECSYTDAFHAAMSDDFNTPEAIAVLFDIAREINRHRDTAGKEAQRLGGLLHQLGGVLGLLQSEPEVFLREVAGNAGAADAGLSDAAIDELIARRLQARADKNWAEADRIRDELDALGILLEDGATGTSWRRK